MVSLNLSRDELRAKLIADVFVLMFRRALLLLLRVVLIRVGLEDEIEERALETITSLFDLLLILLILIPFEIDLFPKLFKVLTQFDWLLLATIEPFRLLQVLMVFEVADDVVEEEEEEVEEEVEEEEHTIGICAVVVDDEWLVLAFLRGRYL